MNVKKQHSDAPQERPGAPASRDLGQETGVSCQPSERLPQLQRVSLLTQGQPASNN